MSQPEIPTWSQQPMPLKSYNSCFVDVRRAVIACAEDQNSLVLKPRTWQRISAAASIIYTSVLSELTIKKEGWSELQNRNTCKIRPDSGLPQNLHDVSVLCCNKSNVDRMVPCGKY
jgi:hypothetical protein